MYTICKAMRKMLWKTKSIEKEIFSDMVIVTDGIVGIKNAHTLDSIIQQLRATTIACSFLRVGSAYSPHCADGLVPYQDLLYFIAAATLGSYMSFNSHVVRRFLIYITALVCVRACVCACVKLNITLIAM